MASWGTSNPDMPRCINLWGILLAAIAVSLAAGRTQAAAPLAMTQQAGPVRATSATLNGMAVAQGQATTAWFEWGADRTYGNTTAPQSVGSGTHVVRITAQLT